MDKLNVLEQAEQLKEQSQYRKALTLFKKAYLSFSREDSPAEVLQCLLSMGDVCRMTGSFDAAVNHYNGAIALAKKLMHKTTAADARVGLGLSLRAQGNWQEALKCISESRKVYEKINDLEGVAFTVWAEAGTFRISGQIRQAIATFKKALAMFKTLKQPSGTGYCLCGLGGTSRVAGLFDDSLRYYSAANSLFTSIRDSFGMAYSYCGTGNALRMKGDFGNALKFLGKATRIYIRIGDTVSYAYTLWSLGATYLMTGKYKKSREHFNSAMRLFRKTKDPRGVIYCRIGFAEADFLEGRPANAKKKLTLAATEAAGHCFAVEECHAKTVLSFVNEGMSDNKCYNNLRIKIRFQGLPFNIP